MAIDQKLIKLGAKYKGWIWYGKFSNNRHSASFSSSFIEQGRREMKKRWKLQNYIYSRAMCKERKSSEVILKKIIRNEKKNLKTSQHYVKGLVSSTQCVHFKSIWIIYKFFGRRLHNCWCEWRIKKNDKIIKFHSQ